MSHKPELSEARRALLEKYLRGEVPRTSTVRDTIPRRAPESPAPLSFGQQQLWLLAQMTPDIPLYNECAIVHMPGPLDIHMLERSLNEIIRRHAAWRTIFPLKNG